jgi:ubiquinone/menaquinone biosynthesis C-methylase UbiE
MGIFRKFFNQTRKPEGRLGRIMLRTMNAGHAGMAEWGMSHLPQISPENIVELGCGAGRNAGELLKRYPKAHVTAVDYSLLSVEKAKEYNKAMIAAGRCTVRQGDVSALPFSDGSFDLATAFETVYFWPGLEKCFSEVYRVLKPGGCFLISNESDGTDAASRKFERIIDGMKPYTAGELETALRAAGFSEVTSDHYKTRPWITVIARK